MRWNIYLLRSRRKLEKEKEGNIWRRKIYYLSPRRKNGEGGIYLVKENILLWRSKKRRRKGGKYLEKEKIFFESEKNGKRNYLTRRRKRREL